MITKIRAHGAIAFVLLTVSSAYAQQEPTLTDPPKENNACDNPDADCPQPQAQQTPTEPAPMPPPTAEPLPPPPPEQQYVEAETPWYEGIGFGLTIGGGVDAFVDGIVQDTTNTGGSWNVRATFGTKTFLAGEVSYIGSAQSIDALGLDDDAILVGNGLQGAARFNVLPGYPVQPFVYVGAAWRHYDLSDVNINTSDVQDSSDVFELPFGVGVSGYISGFMADVRAEYRGAWGDDLVPTFDNDEGDALFGEMDRWGITGSLGVEF